MGRFLLGFVIGAAIGTAVVLVMTPASGDEARQQIRDRFNAALDAGRQATAVREQELWGEFRRRLANEA